MGSRPDRDTEPRRRDQDDRSRRYRCDEHPGELERWDAANVLTRHTGHDPNRCLPYSTALARLSTPLA
ncbi:hypothetical protein [Nocardia asteroides]|uniref:hypothetical protein n=1 Tax=Nocardia asteroides TaxID=1824 RepID=UPI001E46EB8C|nr:hypothetical protein [Nocardia asteroides]UGT59771.1 hypothetical protein LTT61_21400 [Nocardia asteroides]